MTRLSEAVKRHPEMLWDRYSSNLVRCDRPFFCNPEQGTALGMVIFSILPSRCDRTTMDRKRLLAGDPSAIQLVEKIAKDQAVIDLFETTVIPNLWVNMIKQLHIALGMVTHARLGNNAGCFAKILGSDEMNTIFQIMLRDLSVEETKFMIC